MKVPNANLDKKKRYKSFINYVKEVLVLAEYRNLHFSFYGIKYIGKDLKNPRNSEIILSRYSYVNKELVFKTCLFNFFKTLEHLISHQTTKIFFEIKLKTKNATFKFLLCRMFKRKFSLMQRSFFKLKQYCLQYKIRVSRSLSGRYKAGITRLYYFMLQNQMHSFNCIKFFRKKIEIQSIDLEFVVYSLEDIMTQALKTIKLEVLKKLKFMIRIKKLKNSRTLKSKFLAFIKKANKGLQANLKLFFDVWVAHSTTLFFERMYLENLSLSNTPVMS
jgi:hypothetical protein